MRTLPASLFVLLAAGSSSVRADYVVGHADLLCHPTRNLALVRLAQAENENPPAYAALPPELDGGLSRTPGTGRRTCRFPNGLRVTLRAGRDQAYATGMGGGAPPEFFSLWLDDRKIVSKRVWSENNYSAELTPTVAAVVTPDRLTFCEGKGTPACVGQPFTLSAIPVDEVERRSRRANPRAGSLRITAGAGRPVCRSLVRRGHVSPKDHDLDRVGFGNTDGSVPEERVDWIAFPRDPFETDESLRVEIDGSDKADGTSFGRFGGVTRFARADFFGDGVMRTVVKRSSSGNYFNGSFWVVAPAAETLGSVLQRLYPTADERTRNSEDGVIDRALKAGWVVFSGGRPDLFPNVSPLYVHIDRVRIRGTSYFVAYALNNDHDPTALVFKPAPDGRFTALCRFERVRSNF